MSPSLSSRSLRHLGGPTATLTAVATLLVTLVGGPPALAAAPTGTTVAVAPGGSCAQARKVHDRTVERARQVRKAEIAAARTVLRRSDGTARDVQRFRAARGDARQAFRATGRRADAALARRC